MSIKYSTNYLIFPNTTEPELSFKKLLTMEYSHLMPKQKLRIWELKRYAKRIGHEH